VDKARNEAAKQMLANGNLKYLMFFDADMNAHPDFIQRMLMTAFVQQWQDAQGNVWGGTPWADVIGAWCPLRGAPYLPTIDTGTGTWEPTDTGDGPKEVIRTGAACVLMKRHVFERLEYPWYGVRPAPRAIDVFVEIDNFARCKMDGKNPLREHPAWDVLETAAKQDAATQRSRGQQGLANTISSVGEDSNFCDRVRAAGMRIVVNTDIVIEHMERRPITAADHNKAMRESERVVRLAAGITA
jgi:hypothetical protein